MKFCPHCYAPMRDKQVTCADCYDPDVQCRCGAPTEMGPYGIRYSCCDDCADMEPDGEAFRGGEAAAFVRDEMARIYRELK